MKPILFPANATTFTTNGLGRLDPTRCIVTEERNGQFELECELSVDSAHFSDIANNMILVVVPGDGESLHPKPDRQAFRIYEITEPLGGIVTLNARHISYDLSYNTVMPFSATNISGAFSGIASHAVETLNFTFNTDKTTSGVSFKVKTPQTIRSILGGQAGSILDVFGGEYDWNNWTVNLWNQRGSDTNVTLRYGKNITDLNQEQNLENVITGIVPFWTDDETIVTLTEKSVDSQYAGQYPFKRTVPVDFSPEWEEAPSEAKLRNRAQQYITANKIGIPKVSIKVSFVALWQTEEYQNIAPLEKVHLCDTVGVVFEKYGINTRAEVIKTVWDCLAERYTEIELGEARSSLASTIADISTETAQEIVETKSELQKAVDRATAAINGNNGGYVKINATEDGKPYEILIMDRDSEELATKIWRWNLGGLGYSSDGGHNYGLAITQDGEIVADFITAGTMTANRVRAGLLTDEKSYNYWNLTTGEFSLSSATKVGGSTVSSIASSAASSAVSTYDSGLDQEKVFKKLTNNQADQGIYLQNGQLYINASMIKSGYISADRISGGTINGVTISGATINGGEINNTDSLGNVSIKIKNGVIEFGECSLYDGGWHGPNPNQIINMDDDGTYITADDDCQDVYLWTRDLIVRQYGNNYTAVRSELITVRTGSSGSQTKNLRFKNGILVGIE